MDFSKKMEGTNLNDVACCPNGYKLTVGNNDIELKKDVPSNQCSVGARKKFVQKIGSGYELYHADDGWVLKNGDNWTQYTNNGGGEDCCPRDGTMIKFVSNKCDLSENIPGKKPTCSWPEGVTAQIHCA